MSALPTLGAVELRLSDDDRRAIAALVAAEMADRQRLTDDALSVLKQGDVAKLLKIDQSTLVQWERDGILVPFVREGKVIRYSRQQLAAFQERGRS